MRQWGDWLDLLGRALLGTTFIYWGARKLVDVLGIGAPDQGGWTGYMEARGVAGELLPLVILTELGGGLLLLIGFKNRYAAIALAGFCILANWFFHTGFDLPSPVGHFNWVIFIKNFAVAGGLLVLAGRGAGAYSLDGRVGARGRESVNA
ncbi:MAG TPA: DoxX family protein [Allosphingosinicella sp.]|uniref:DoxX family protein n=1 Tax=Allosphingosinicella sp. TaxID=2823234 RepID=UPI002ED7DEC0